MELLTAICGLPCGTCPIRLATLEPDESKRRELRAEIARQCVEEYGMQLSLEAITDCDGCRSGGRLFSGCQQCRVRPCAVARGLESCAFCEDYACAVLQEHLAREMVSRDRLARMREDWLEGL